MADPRNAKRFTGFATTYEQTRPSVPTYPVDIITRYLGHEPQTVLDLGCGTGLSTAVWQHRCGHVIGIEPSPDMIAEARRKETAAMTFIQAYGDNVPLADGTADVIVCSQSFHWMEPVATLREVNRLLVSGGVFATIDYDWPPVMNWEAEEAFRTFQKAVHEVERTLPDMQETYTRYDKSRHLANIAASGYFRYMREVLFANQESCTPERLIGLPLSLGGVQTVMKHHPGVLAEAYETYAATIRRLVNGTFPIDVCYRMRLGIK